MNTPALRATAEAAADVLAAAAAAALDGDEAFIVVQANETLGDLVGVSGWQNRLGPRYE